MLLGKVWILLAPLIIRLVVYTAMLAAMVAVAAIIAVVFANAGAAEELWIRLRPGVVAGETLFVAVAIVVWLADLYALRGKLRHKQVSLREFLSWPLEQRKAWKQAD